MVWSSKTFDSEAHEINNTSDNKILECLNEKKQLNEEFRKAKLDLEGEQKKHIIPVWNFSVPRSGHQVPVEQEGAQLDSTYCVV